ncbi:DsbC family protein [Thermocrinis sp.]|uniref:DsbC family protein n=1 Tax=Thermocrinis sp. TaxID=2024383 RepID=UPI002FDD6B40
MMKKKVAALGIILGAFGGMVSCQQTKACPTEDKIKAGVKDLIPQEFKVESVQTLQAIPGLCEVVIKVGPQPLVFYTDKEMKYLMAGNLISLADKKNITRERQQEFMKVSQDQLKELEKHTDFTFGQKSSGKFIYMFTDPDCPFCKRSEPIVEKWAQEKGVEVRVVLFPLPIHPDAFPKSVSLICDKKGWEEYKNGYKSNNQCEEGKRKVEGNLALAERFGINGTPTFIGSNGRIHSGLPTDEDLNKLIN